MSCLQCFMNQTTAKLTKIPWISQQLRAPPHPKAVFCLHMYLDTIFDRRICRDSNTQDPTASPPSPAVEVFQSPRYFFSYFTNLIKYVLSSRLSVFFFTIVYQLRTRAAWIVLYTCLRVIRAVQSALHTLFNRQDLSRELYQLSWAPYHVYLNAGLIDWDCPSLLRLVFLENY